MVQPPAAILMKEHTAAELHLRLAGLGVTARIARRLQAAVLKQRGAEIPCEMPEVSPRLLARVREAVGIPRLVLLDKAVSPKDGFTKYLFGGAGPEPFEAVGIPLLHRTEQAFLGRQQKPLSIDIDAAAFQDHAARTGLRLNGLHSQDARDTARHRSFPPSEGPPIPSTP